MCNDEIVDWDMYIIPPKRDMVGEYILMPIEKYEEVEAVLKRAIEHINALAMCSKIACGQYHITPQDRCKAIVYFVSIALNKEEEQELAEETIVKECVEEWRNEST